MDDSARRYLEAQVMTATPQKLRLLLIEGAIRFARQASACWDEERNEEAMEALIRSRSIISELLSGIRVEESELTRQVAGVYLFLFRCLTEAQLKRDRNRLEEALRVLEVERETWQMVCEQMPDAPVAPSTQGASPPTEIFAPAVGIDGPVRSEYSFDA